MKNRTERIYKNRSVGIVGLGLIGSSLARRFMQADKTINIVGVDNDNETLKYAFENDIIHLGHSDYRILKGCDIIFVATPLDTVSDTINGLYKAVGDTALITDTASIKKSVMDSLPGGIRFVGGHPMAGRERGGIKSGQAHLFENAYYVVTAGEKSKKEDVEKLKNYINILGAICIETDAETHDGAVSKVSHLPHYISYALVNAASGEIENKIGATSYKDMTRVASSSPAFWAAAARLNRDNILGAVNNFGNELNKIKELIDKEDYGGLEQLLESARLKREQISILKADNYTLNIDVIDAPGVIGKITTILGAKKINIRNIAIHNSREDEAGALVLQFADEKSFEAGKAVLGKKYNIRQ